MANNEIRVGDAGTVISVVLKDGDVPIDASQADTVHIVWQRPNNTTGFQETMTANTDGSDGAFYWTSQASSWDVDGIWKFQCVVTFPATIWRSTIKSLQIHPNLTPTLDP